MNKRPTLPDLAQQCQGLFFWFRSCFQFLYCLGTLFTVSGMDLVAHNAHFTGLGREHGLLALSILLWNCSRSSGKSSHFSRSPHLPRAETQRLVWNIIGCMCEIYERHYLQESGVWALWPNCLWPHFSPRVNGVCFLGSQFLSKRFPQL